MNIQEHEGKFHVMEEDDVLGVFLTRRGALAFVATEEQEPGVGPWADAARRQQAAREVHVHNPIEEGLKQLTHIHEFDKVSHTHPGYGPGRFPDNDNTTSTSGK